MYPQIGVPHEVVVEARVGKASKTSDAPAPHGTTASSIHIDITPDPRPTPYLRLKPGEKHLMSAYDADHVNCCGCPAPLEGMAGGEDSAPGEHGKLGKRNTLMITDKRVVLRFCKYIFCQRVFAYSKEESFKISDCKV